MSKYERNTTVIRKDNVRSSTAKIWGICAFLLILILGRACSNSFYYLLAILGIAIFASLSPEKSIGILLFVLPFSEILKNDVESMTCFTFFFFIVVLRMCLQKTEFLSNILITVLLFGAYGLLISGIEKLTTVVTMVMGFLFIYKVHDYKIDLETTILLYAVGILLASILSLFKDSLPIVSRFIQYQGLKLSQDNTAIRFSGLQSNPNYYTLDLVFVLACMVAICAQRKKTKLSYIVLFIGLSVFGIMSVSKSFLISWFILLIIWLLTNIAIDIKHLYSYVFFGIVGLIVIYYFAHDYLDLFFSRFAITEETSLNQMTTGRYEIWLNYIREFFDNPRIILVGKGLNTLATDGKGTHNTYIELLFSLGVLGTGLYLVTLKSCMQRILTDKVIWIPIIVLLVRMFAIGIVTYDNTCFYYALIAIMSMHFSSQSNTVILKKRKWIK